MNPAFIGGSEETSSLSAEVYTSAFETGIYVGAQPIRSDVVTTP